MAAGCLEFILKFAILRKSIKITSCIVLVVALGGLSGVMFDRFLMPWLSSFEKLNNMAIFQKANKDVTVINKTEQVIVKEEFSVAEMTEKVQPSVVKIISYREPKDKDTEDTDFRIDSNEDIQGNVKTGLIITNDGLIVSVRRDRTEKQSLNQNLKFKVLISDEKESDAELVFQDPYSQLEFYKVKEDNLPIPTFGESSRIRAGEKMVVIGNATGEYQNTFSMGIVNEVNRSYTLLNSRLASSETIEGAILTDAKIGRKNLGGPVVGYDGRVIGIANMIQKDGEEIGFVMPIDKLKSTISRVVRGEKIERPSLGVYYLTVDKEIAILNSLEKPEGALVYSFSNQQGLAVKSGSSAALSGIRINDIILTAGNKELNGTKSLSALISTHRRGEEVELKVLRGEDQIELSVVLE